MSVKLPLASTSIDGILLNTTQTIQGDKTASIPTGAPVWTFDKVATAAATSNHAVAVQRSGAAVQLVIGYNDSATNMYFGTSTNHSMDFRTNNTKVGAVDANGVWSFGPSSAPISSHIATGVMEVSGKRISSGTFSVGAGTTAADDTERLAYQLVNTVLTSGTPRFQYMANKSGSGIHGWGVDSSGGMYFGRGTASTGFIDAIRYAVVSTAGQWSFGPSSGGQVVHEVWGAVVGRPLITNLFSVGFNYRLDGTTSPRNDNTRTGAAITFQGNTTNTPTAIEFRVNQFNDSTSTDSDIVGSIDGSGLWTIGQGTSTIHRINTANTSSVGAAGGASALPATPLGYWQVNINGSNVRIPYYN